MKHHSVHSPFSRRVALGLLVGAGVAGLAAACRTPGSQPEYVVRPESSTQEGFAPFVEPDFPFITTIVDARETGPRFAQGNVATRAVVLMLGDSTYAAFDPDLLRMAIGWRGGFLEMRTMAQVSYLEPGNKDNAIPRVLGRPLFTTGVYPGWAAGEATFRDPRPAGPNPADPGRGPLPVQRGRWNGLHVVGDHAVLSYTVWRTEVLEEPSSVQAGGEVGIERRFQIARIEDPLTLVLAEVPGARFEVSGGTAIAHQGAGGDTVTVVGTADLPPGSQLRVVEDRYLTLHIPAGIPPSPFRVVLWRGPAAERAAVDDMTAGRTPRIRYAGGGPSHWRGLVVTQGEVAPDTASYVVDRLTLPVPNPWRRNVRVAGIDFFSDGRAALVTFDGDVWTLGGIDPTLRKLRWKRFASGLYEPLSVQVVDDEVYVYGREGIVRLEDVNGDGEADRYENFSNLVVQPLESREFPLGMEARPGGGFYLAKGGALDNGPKTAPAVAPGFRAGSQHAGTILEVSRDGRGLSVFASGLREPILGVNPVTGMVTASDQQGNFVPSTPIYVVKRGGYYGVPPTAHRDSIPTTVPEPLVWIPHEVDQSGAAQTWSTDGRMGFEGGALFHMSYGRPGVFRVYFDSTTAGVQGSLTPLVHDFPYPVLRGTVRPQDGQLYLAGFQIWGSNARGISGLERVRYTGKPSTLPTAVHAGQQGLLLSFAVPLDRASATDPSRYHVQRWDYVRTEKYGSGHFRTDGAPGQETLPVASANLSEDGKALLLVLPDMKPVMQVQLDYDLRAADGRAATDTLWLTVNHASPLDLGAAGFGSVDWKADAARAAATLSSSATPPAGTASAAAGAALFQSKGCAACHSVDGSTAGKIGPTMKGLYLSNVALEDGSSHRADVDYLRESILDPAKRVVKGYEAAMPSFLGVLSDTEVQSLVLYIQSLGE
jgi:cytochrome c2